MGTGHYVPERVVTNEELVAYVGGVPSRIQEKTGIRARHYASASQPTSHLGERAARAALEDAGLGPQDIDALIFATLSPDVMFPGCGVLLQDAMGFGPIPALDVRNQCSGYLYALSVADAWIRAGVHRRVLVVGAEVHSAGLDFSEQGRTITMLFGDGAGAVVLEASEDEDAGVLGVRLGADGSGAEHLWCEVPGSRSGKHLTHKDLREGRHFPTMNGRTVFRRAIETLTRETSEMLEAHGVEDRDRLVLVAHQANMRINEHLGKHLGLAPEQLVHTIQEFGNTTAASIPMALDVARRRGMLEPGTLVLHAAFGSGFTWGTALVKM